MAKYVDSAGVEVLWGQIRDRDTTTLNAAKNDATTKVNTLSSKIQDGNPSSSVGGIIAGRANADADGNVISTTYETKADANSKKTALESSIKDLRDDLTSTDGTVGTLQGDVRNLEAKVGSGTASTKSLSEVADLAEAFMDTKGKANGLASLGTDGKVPAAQLPSYVDDVVEYANLSAFPATGEAGKIYVAKDTNKTYRWTGTSYIVISETLALGETSSTAYAGDKGKANADEIVKIKNRITGIESSIGTINTKIISIENRIDSVISDIDQLDTAIVSVKDRVVAVEEELAGLVPLTEAELLAILV